MRLRFSLPIFLLTLAAATASAQPKRAGDCDRHCLLVFLTEYTEALTDNNVARLALAPTVRVTPQSSATLVCASGAPGMTE